MFSSLLKTCSLAFEAINEVKSQFISPDLRFNRARLLPQLSPLNSSSLFLPTLGCWPSTASSYPIASCLLCLSLWPYLSPPPLLTSQQHVHARHTVLSSCMLLGGATTLLLWFELLITCLHLLSHQVNSNFLLLYFIKLCPCRCVVSKVTFKL